MIPLPTPPEQFNWPDWRGADLASRAAESRQLPLVVPAETNVTMLGNGQWFWAHQAPAPGAAWWTSSSSVGRTAT